MPSATRFPDELSNCYFSKNCPQNGKIRVIDFLGTRLSAANMSVLGNALLTNSTLTSLSLFRNCIYQAGAQVLGDVLKSNSALRTLDVGGNQIKPYGGRALAEALKKNSTLTSLNIEDNLLGKNGTFRYCDS